MSIRGMKASGIAAAVALAIVAMTGWSLHSAPAAQAAGPAIYRLDVSVVPQDAARKHFVCDVTLRNLANDELLFAPHISAAAGQEASSMSGSQDSGAVYIFSVRVDPSTESAIYSLNVTENKKVLFLHRATIYLKPKA